MKYRQEIDGLRAVAVVSVILFHAGFGKLSGGFVGVDVFFVISGYLITTLILEERAAGAFSLRRFYERRARRILPALYVMTVACIPFAMWLMLPDEGADFFRATIAVLLFVSNFWMWQHSGYFQPSSDTNPLMHTWSLAVEEQYYLLFPLLLLWLWRFGPRALATAVVLLVGASLGLAEIGWRVAPETSFFLLPTRAWELGVGSLTALAMFRNTAALPGWLAELGAAAGLVAILVAVAAFGPATPFPGLFALLPVLGAAAFIRCAGQGTLAGRLLGLPPLRLVGLISYSAYLWHQPLFAFARIGLESPGRWQMLALAFLSLVLAALSWRFVEQPFRDPARIRVPARLAAASAGLLAAALVLPGMDRPAASFPQRTRELMVPQDERNAYVLAPYAQAKDAGFVGRGGRKVLVVGDSHALDFWNMAREVGAFADDRLALAYVFTECQVVLDDAGTDANRKARDRAGCAADKGPAASRALAREAAVVIFVASWKDWAAARLPATLAGYHFRPDQQVLVVSGKSFRGVNLRRLVGGDPAAYPQVRGEQRGPFRSATEVLRASLPAAMLVDIQAIVCGPGWDCPLFTPEGHLISHDGSHLTREGARYLGQLLFRDPRLAPFLPRWHAVERGTSRAG
jgi:peptidoglycan/LPS O-acetylase OafA/YrhL